MLLSKYFNLDNSLVINNRTQVFDFVDVKPDCTSCDLKITIANSNNQRLLECIPDNDRLLTVKYATNCYFDIISKFHARRLIVGQQVDTPFFFKKERKITFCYSGPSNVVANVARMLDNYMRKLHGENFNITRKQSCVILDHLSHVSDRTHDQTYSLYLSSPHVPKEPVDSQDEPFHFLTCWSEFVFVHCNERVDMNKAAVATATDTSLKFTVTIVSMVIEVLMILCSIALLQFSI